MCLLGPRRAIALDHCQSGSTRRKLLAYRRQSSNSTANDDDCEGHLVVRHLCKSSRSSLSASELQDMVERRGDVFSKGLVVGHLESWSALLITGAPTVHVPNIAPFGTLPYSLSHSRRISRSRTTCCLRERYSPNVDEMWRDAGKASIDCPSRTELCRADTNRALDPLLRDRRTFPHTTSYSCRSRFDPSAQHIGMRYDHCEAEAVKYAQRVVCYKSSVDISIPFFSPLCLCLAFVKPTSIPPYYLSLTSIMSAVQTQSPLTESQLRLKAEGIAGNDWQADLARDGFAVVKGAIPREKADKYAERLHEWLEGL